jgi:hypothetical protein
MVAEEEKGPEKIIEFRQRPENAPWDPKTENLAQVKRHGWTPDEHKHGPFTVDDKEREVSCKRCGKVLDPIYVICIIAEFWHEMDWKIKVYEDLKKRQDEKYAREQKRRQERQKGGTML